MSAFARISSVLPPGTDLLGGAAEGPLVTHNGSLAGTRQSVGMTVAPAVIGMGASLLRTSITPFATLFDYYFGPGGLRVAKATIQRFVERASRLYEQERERPDCPSALGMYVRRWNG